MKKFKWIVVGILSGYIVIASLLCYLMNQNQLDQNNRYRVEMKRIIETVNERNDLAKAESLQEIYELPVTDYSDTQDIYKIRYISGNITDPDILEKFYHAENQYQYEIVPVRDNNKINGYYRFDYRKNISLAKGLIFAEIALALFVILVLLILCYLYRNILRPFHNFSQVPYELSRGNLNISVKESKNRYFGKFLWGIGMLKDTLDLHRKKELKLSKDKKMILLSVSHDIKTPLNAISLYAKAIEDDIYQTEIEKKDAVKRIQEKVEEINQFVQTIVKSSTEDVISIEVDPEADFYLKDLNTKLEAGYAEKCMLRHLKFTIQNADNILIKGDMDRIYEALGNLIENALKYGDGDKIDITFTQEEYCQLIHVFNSGIPVDVAEMPHLFESFYRGTNTTGHQGNGLGLYICHEIMKKSNGDIYANRHQDGMEFVLVCPIA